MHKLDEKVLITPALLKRFGAEAEAYGGEYVAYIQKMDGRLLEHQQAGSPGMTHDQQMLAHDLLNHLNRDLHHDGAWAVVGIAPNPLSLVAALASPTADYRILCFLWLDAEGDVRFPLEFESSVADMAAKGIHYWLEQAENAWKTWKGLMIDVLDPKPGQQFARAQGENAPSSKLIH